MFIFLRSSTPGRLLRVLFRSRTLQEKKRRHCQAPVCGAAVLFLRSSVGMCVRLPHFSYDTHRVEVPSGYHRRDPLAQNLRHARWTSFGGRDFKSFHSEAQSSPDEKGKGQKTTSSLLKRTFETKYWHAHDRGWKLSLDARTLKECVGRRTWK